ncbi:MAG: magnesium/cobalt transporter CorA [Candidatus Margulisiibacteriota bacterium]|mgnify:CR=1 FL=1
MPGKLTKKRSTKSGLPAGSLVHIGDKNTQKPKVSILEYGRDSYKEIFPDDLEDYFAKKESSPVTWIDIENIHDIPLMEKIGAHYNIHPLILEDILNTDQRPKIEDMDRYAYIVLRMIGYDPKKNEIMQEQISLILGEGFVISFQEGIEGDAFGSVRQQIKSSKGKIREMGADYLAYALTDAIVDNYFLVTEKIGDRIETVEEELVKNPSQNTLHILHVLKRDMIFLRRAVWPLRDVIAKLEKEPLSLIRESTRLYLRDVYDHTIQVIDTVETFRDMLSGMLDIYLSSISNRLNAVMKTLTIIATIFMPLTFLAGVYGMNFKHFPELSWKLGYPAFWLISALISFIMLAYFRKKKWI